MFNSILEAMNEVVIIVNSELEVKYVNKAYEDKFYLSAEAVIGSHLHDTPSPMDNKNWIITKTLETQEEQESSQIAFHWNDRTIYLSGYTKLLKVNDETIIAAYYTDITKYVKQRKKQTSLIEQMTANIVTVTDEFALLPLQPILIEAQKELILEKVPQTCSKLGLDYLVIQMDSIKEVDDELAHLIDNLIKVLTLLGVEVIISGLNPISAPPFIRNHILFSNTQIFANMQAIVDYFQRKEVIES